MTPHSPTLGPIGVFVGREQLVQYAAASGDYNPIHYDSEAAKSFGLPGVVIHGMLNMAMLDNLLIPFYQQGYRLQHYQARFRQIVQPGQVLQLQGTVHEDSEGQRLVDMTLTPDGGTKPAVTAHAVLRLIQPASASRGTQTG